MSVWTSAAASSLAVSLTLSSLTLAGLASSGVLLTGCLKKAGPLAGVTPVPSVSASTVTVITPVGIVNDSEGFRVSVLLPSPTVSYLIHGGSDSSGSLSLSSQNSYSYTTPCAIQSGSADLRDLMCYVEGDEGDLYYWGATLQHNVPASMCTYVRISLPWYYNFPTGTSTIVPTYAPTSSPYSFATNSVFVDGDLTIAPLPYCPYNFLGWQSLYSSNFGGSNAGIFSSATGLPSAIGIPDTTANLSQTFLNCCTGSYPSTSGLTAWGGKEGKCIAGPAVDLQKLDVNGFPKSDIYYVATIGLNGAYTVVSPLNKSLHSNLYIANYFTPSSRTLSTQNNNFNDPSQWPSAFVPSNNTARVPTVSTANASSVNVISLVAGSPTSSKAQPFYMYECLDSAFDLQYRIRVMIRSWSTTAAYASANVALNSGGWTVASSTLRYGLATLGFVGITDASNPYAVFSSSNPFDVSPLAPTSLHDLIVWDELFPSAATSALSDTSGTSYFYNSGTYTYPNYTVGFPYGN